ncbi:hypothetical protein ACTQ49_10445 [Luteococcus sp. Sow4_B9]|uniref:hypothetical protein n=1 Tax=Luteococcus sp. Sow4_B9 TaxID=3438792 RepID=UPI003F963CD4
MAININLDVRQDVEPLNQPIPRTFVGFDPKMSDEQLWNANRGAWLLPEEAAQEKFATFSHDGTIRLVAELEGIESVEQDGEAVHALMGRLLHRGDPVRDSLVGTPVEATAAGFTFTDTTEQDEMTAAERYSPSERNRRTFLVRMNADQWFWTPEDEEEIIRRTAAGAPVRETWPSGGRRQGIEPGDRIYLVYVKDGQFSVRGSGLVSSRIYAGEHWDDPMRTANYIDIDWDTVLPMDRAIPRDVLLDKVPGYAWNPQKGGVELHEPMASQMEEFWQEELGEENPAPVEAVVGWEHDDARRRVLNTAARERILETFESDGWEVAETNEERPFCAVAYRDDLVRYLFAKGAETVGRPVLFTAQEVEHIQAHPDSCVLGLLSDVEFEQGSVVEDASGIFTVSDLTVEEGRFQPVLFKYETAPAAE